MRVLSCEEIVYISGAVINPSYFDDPMNPIAINYENYPLRTYLKTRGLCGSLTFAVLMAPGGLPLIALGSALGLGLGLSYGYVEWLTLE